MGLASFFNYVKTISILGAVGGIGYLGYRIYQEIGGEPERGFKDLESDYWTGLLGRGERYSPGGKAPILDGQQFGGTVSFKAKNVEGTYKAGFWANVQGKRVWADLADVEVSAGEKWVPYALNVSGVMDTGTLQPCRLIDTVKEIQSPDGTVVLDDGDTDCYHVISGASLVHLIEAEYWSEENGRYDMEPPGSLLPIKDGQNFGGRVHFEHYGAPAYVRVRISCYVEGVYEWTEYGDITTGYDDGWKTYKVRTGDGTFDARGLSACRRIDTNYEVQQRVGDYNWDDPISDGDTECYHVIE